MMTFPAVKRVRHAVVTPVGNEREQLVSLIEFVIIQVVAELLAVT